jgi:hypothetical protein
MHKKNILLLVILSVLLIVSSCKKDNNNNNCNRVKEIVTESEADKVRKYQFTYNNDGSLQSKTIQIPDNGYNASSTYIYENGGKKISEQISNGYTNRYELNDKGYITYEEWDYTTVIVKLNYTYDLNGFLATKSLESVTVSNGKLNSKYFTEYTNTVTNGNLIKTVLKDKDILKSKETNFINTYEYNLAKPANNEVPLLFTNNGIAANFKIGNGYGQKNTNQLIKYISTSGDKYSFDYSYDSQNRLVQTSITDVSGGTSTNNRKIMYTYQCN